MLRQVKGDATKPQFLGNDTKVIIPHVCNDIGMWGSGFVLALNNAFGFGPRQAYLRWYGGERGAFADDAYGISVHYATPQGEKPAFQLGQTQFVTLKGKNIVIASMVAQHAVKVRGWEDDDRPPIRYGALLDCMRQVQYVAAQNNAEIHAPRFGSDLAGGAWDVILQMIREEWVDKNITTTIYEWVPPSSNPLDRFQFNEEKHP